LRDQKQALLEEIGATNPATLNEIKPPSGNDVARVNAVKALEQRKDGVVEEIGSSVTRHAPGLVVQIVHVTGEVTQTIGAQPPLSMIAVTPERDAPEPPVR
jgi:hypothetical protein